jgi:hypothetical protein
MNVIINKEDKKVIWINEDKNKLPPTEILGSFDPSTMQAVYCPGYIPRIEYIFRPTITGYNTIVAFEQTTVWNKTTLTPRQLTSWNDEIQETETTKEPIKDGEKYNIFQSFVGGKWVLDVKAKEDFDKKVRITELKNLLSSSDWRMTVDKYESMTSQDQTLWKNNRAAWRAEINGLET